MTGIYTVYDLLTIVNRDGIQTTSSKPTIGCKTNDGKRSHQA